MMASQSYGKTDNQDSGRYRNRQDLLKHLLKNKVDINTKATYLALYDIFEIMDNEFEDRIKSGEWDGIIAFFGHDRKNSPLEINGTFCEKISGNYSIWMPDGKRKFLNDYLKHNYAVRFDKDTGGVTGIKERIEVNPTRVAINQGLMPPYMKVSPEMFLALKELRECRNELRKKWLTTK